MKTIEVISKLNSEFGWNLKNNGGFSPTQLMIIEDTVNVISSELTEKIKEMIERRKGLQDLQYDKKKFERNYEYIENLQHEIDVLTEVSNLIQREIK